MNFEVRLTYRLLISIVVLFGAGLGRALAAPEFSVEIDLQEQRAYLLRNGLAVVGSDAFAVDANAPHAVRVSLGAARNRAELVEGLEMLASVVGMTAVESQIV